MVKNNKKGFSLVELLAVVVLLGILSVVAIIGVNSVIKKANIKYYETQENTLKMAAQSYTQDNRSALPKNIGQSKSIYLKTLQEKKYVEEIKDRQGKACNSEDSYVRVFKSSQNSYEYTAYLVCNEYKSGDNNNKYNGPTIKVTYKDTKIDKDDIKLEEKTIFSKVSGISIIATSYDNPYLSLNFTSENAILSYDYIIYECFDDNCTLNQVLKSSGSKEASHQKKVNVDNAISLKKYLPRNLIKVVVNVIDKYGNDSTKIIKLQISDAKDPTCGEISGEGSSTNWINKASSELMREITVKCVDSTSGSKCEREIYSQIFDANNINDNVSIGTIEIKSTNGGTNNCPVKVYIDTTAPTTPVIDNPYFDGSDTDFTITASSSDKISGIDHFEYRYPNSSVEDEKNWTQFGEKNSTKVSLEVSGKRDEILEVRACDVAGNCSSAAQTNIKITGAGCKYSGELKSGSTYVNGQYTYTYNGSTGWAIKLTDKNSTDAVTSDICTTVNGKPIVSARSMFSGSMASSINLSTFDTSNVTDMYAMFYNTPVTVLDVSKFNTSKVTDMSLMFNNTKATTIDVSGFDTSNVTNMSYMFAASKATTLDVSGFDTSNVTNMMYMFSGSKATTIDVSGFDTSKVTDMEAMFRNTQVTTLDVSGFDTSKVTNMSYMLYISSATTLDVSGFDTSKVTDMNGMFLMSNATILDVSKFDTSNVTDMSLMFAKTNATTLDLSSFDTSKVTDMNSMFSDAKATVGYARTQADADRLNASSSKPSSLTFKVK